MKKYLVLDNGMTFEGGSFGAEHDTAAEIVFCTSMTGYTGTLTDPRFAGQAVCMTFPLLGNAGVNEEDCESGVSPAAVIVREICDEPSNFRSEMTLGAFLRQRGVPGISGIDTRLLTKILRENGTVTGAVVSDPADAPAVLSARKPPATAASVSVKEIRHIPAPSGNARCRAALLDLGVTAGVLAELNRLGCELDVLPYDTGAEDILALRPDGIFVSGGPGSPYDCPAVRETLAALLPSGIPMMAVGLGHQILALANGMTAEKLPYGHRGSGQPVRDLASGRLYSTAQNHGWTVTGAGECAVLSFENVNDGTAEGLEYKHIPAFSVQFLPDTGEIAAGTGFLYRKFLRMMTGEEAR